MFRLKINSISSPVLIGEPSLFPLESRIFHGISIGLILLSALYVPYNLFAGLHVAAVSALFVCLFFCYQYYNSRFKAVPHKSTLFGVLGILIFGFNYFSNSGIDGSTDLIWPAYLLLLLAISPYKQHLGWLLVYLLSFFIIHVVEHYYPHLVSHPFNTGNGQFIDRLTAFPMPAIAVYIIIRYIRRGYDRERQATEEKNAALEISKAQISEQKDQLEERNIEKNKLMSIIFHDLRAPLVNIQSYLQLLTGNELEPQERLMLENSLLKSTSNSLDMLSNLLHWSKSQMEGTTLNLLDVNLLSVLSSTLEMEKLYAAKKEIALSYTVPSSLTVVADVDMLQLVIRNLISNAVKFTPKGGLIKVEAQVQQGECILAISDNGNGIPPDKQDAIFSIKTAPSFGTDNEKGAGLGLVLCKEFMERQGGRVGFKSNLGKGSTFFVYLPLKAVA